MAHPVSMQDLFTADGKANIFGWIIFLGTIAIIGFTIYQMYLSITKISTSDEEQKKKIAELEFNLKAIRGTQYTKL